MTINRMTYWLAAALVLQTTALVGCAGTRQIRRVANVPPATGTPTSGIALGKLNVRAAFDAFPMHSFMRTQSEQELGDVGLHVQTTQLGGSVRLGISDNINLGLRYDSGLEGVTRSSHDSVAPSPNDVAHGLSFEVEGSWEVSKVGYLGFYGNLGIWEIPYAVYEAPEGSNTFTREANDTDTKLSAHIAFLGGAKWEWVAVYAGLNLQTAFQNEGYALETTSAADLLALVQPFRGSSGDEAPIQTVLLPPTFFVGAELLAFRFITLGVQAWYTVPFGDRVQAVPGVGAWLAFNSGGLASSRAKKKERDDELSSRF